MLRTDRKAIKSAVSQDATEKAIGLRLAYNVPVDKMKPLSSLVRNREMRKYCYNSIYASSVMKRVRCKLEIDSLYSDSINAVLIPVQDSRISGENISFALQSSKPLKLDKAQYDYMMDRALDMARRIKKNRTLNVWNEEMNILRNTLSSNQLTYYFVLKNLDKVTEEINTGWKKIVAAGLSEQVDSAKEFPLAFKYYQEYHRIKDLYRYYGTSQKKHIMELEKHKPPMVQMLVALEREEKEKEQNKLFILLYYI